MSEICHVLMLNSQSFALVKQHKPVTQMSLS